MSVIGIDTSNYTTSIAFLSESTAENCSKLLPVKEGELGLRQSDAVFSHIRSLPELSGRLFSRVSREGISAVGVSTRPRAVEGSYMPCFLVGYSHAKLLADSLGVPLVEVSHQQGHVAAALWGAKRMELMDQPHLAWHLSGGTTELLLVEPQGRNVSCTRVGGTSDISAGQLIDRTGQMLGLSFPAGKYLDELSREASGTEVFPVKWDSESGPAVSQCAWTACGNCRICPSLRLPRSVQGDGAGHGAVSGTCGGVFRRRCLQCHAAAGGGAVQPGVCTCPVFHG